MSDDTVYFPTMRMRTSALELLPLGTFFRSTVFEQLLDAPEGLRVDGPD